MSNRIQSDVNILVGYIKHTADAKSVTVISRRIKEILRGCRVHIRDTDKNGMIINSITGSDGLVECHVKIELPAGDSRPEFRLFYLGKELEIIENN